MKKAFNFFAVALAACSMMFVSCGEENTGETKYEIKTAVNDEAMGKVLGGGSYAENATVTLTAVANDGYEFVQWQDGTNTNPRDIIVSKDETYTATFKAKASAPANGVNVNFGGQKWTAAPDATEGYYVQDFAYVMAASALSGQNFEFPVVNTFATANKGTYNVTLDESTLSLGDDVQTIEYYEETSLTDGTNQYGDWWAKTATYVVNNFDANTLAYTASVDAVMFSALEALVDMVGIADASTKTLTIGMGVTLEPYSKSAKTLARNKTAKLFVK